MYLKSLVIQGFKSFADKTELEFRSGITAVVGPNGSGKSNIADAVRWVLGEQSVKQLRGGKMEDVIFAGTQFRKPLGQASVSLTLDNSCQTLPVPYNEVTVTRRLYRSGESEYLINNNVVRMRDIHELFMDTGIGREGYSMIGQGKIDAILSGKPEERRSLVEEAAGITKFKSRKEEGEKKLSNAQDNLDRVEDILSTYEERIGPLKLEKEKAETYLELSAEMKDLQVSVILAELDDLETRNQGLVAEKGVLKADFERSSQMKLETENSTRALEDEIQALSEEKGRSRESFYLNKGTADELQADCALLEERKRSLQERMASDRLRRAELEDGLHGECGSAEKARALLLEKEQGFRDIRAAEEFLRQEANDLDAEISESEQESARLKQKEEDQRQTIQAMDRILSESRANLQYLKAKQENLESISQNYEASLHLNQEGAAKLEAQQKDLNANKTVLEKQLAEKKTKIAEEEENSQTLVRTLESLRRTIRDGQSREAMLKNLEEAHEGYARSVRDLFSYLRRSKSELLENAHILGDVIHTRSEYSAAIESALGGYVGNVITGSDEEAKALIEILKKQKLGRCTFLPRNVIRANRMKLPDFHRVKVLGLASDLVDTDDAFREIVDSILARTIIVKNMDDAVLAARETGYKVKIVTLDGDIIQGGGAMTGGSQKGRSAGVLSRKAELDEIAENIRVNTEVFHKTKADYDSRKVLLDRERSSASDLAEQLRGLELEETRLKERIAAFHREVERIITLKNEQDQSGASLTSEISQATDALSGKEKELTFARQTLEDIRIAMADLRELRRELYARHDGLNEKLADHRVHVTRWEKDAASAREELTRLEETIHAKEKRLEELSLEESNQEQEIRNIDVSILEKKQERDAVLHSMSELEQKRDVLDRKEVMVRARIREDQGLLETARQEYYRLEKDLLKVTLSLEKYEADKAELMTRLNDDLELTLAEARDLGRPLESKSRAKKRIAEIRSRISGLGTVNLSAVEEYRTVSEHYEFLSRQREDLLRSKEDLLKLIAEMTGKMRLLFNENFVILSRNFRETFRQLFNGGTAELVLGEGDVLTGAIDIHVQPPGKKLQNINLLSGGEKVLSAIALTFAILRMKPSPFCFLDEIEAALDDANVYRYASFIREFAKETQFILVTHRKGTMEAANILYGVTMEEKGISKIVSVDLDHMEENAING